MEVNDMNPIKDYIRKDLHILFVGFNPSIRSSQTGHHYANPNNRFWKILYLAGLTKEQLTPFDDQSLLQIGYGFTNIVARPTKAASEITKEEYEEGRIQLQRKIKYFRPKIVCFVGKGVYLQYAKKKQSPWGFQDNPIIPGVQDFVAPSSSGLVRMKLEEIVSIYKQLNDTMRKCLETEHM